MEHNTIKQYNRCIICNNKKQKASSRTCGNQLCLKMYFNGVHLARTGIDKALICYLIRGDPKYKDILISLTIKKLKASISRLKNRNKELYFNNIIKIEDLCRDNMIQEFKNV